MCIRDSRRTRDNSEEYIQFKAGGYVEAQSTNLAGGTLISNGAYEFTLGFGGYYGGKNAFITCGHNLNVGQSIYWNGNKIGTVVRLSLIHISLLPYCRFVAYNNYKSGGKAIFMCNRRGRCV